MNKKRCKYDDIIEIVINRERVLKGKEKIFEYITQTIKDKIEAITWQYRVIEGITGGSPHGNFNVCSVKIEQEENKKRLRIKGDDLEEWPYCKEIEKFVNNQISNIKIIVLFNIKGLKHKRQKCVFKVVGN